ncbi:MAG: CBS domain-containing protein [Anaerolineales bacterium]|jgi:CBS domain-containing protein|nr:CBS domain-containing protein [Anaerolineales bacterium]
MNKVKQILKNKGNQVWSVSPESSVLDALKVMGEHNTGGVLVLEGETLVGIFTERDYARKVGLLDLAPSSVKIAEVMTRDLVSVTAEDSVNQCMELITEHHIRHLPVIENQQVLGVISIGDVVKDMIEELKFAVKQLENYIVYFR